MKVGKLYKTLRDLWPYNHGGYLLIPKNSVVMIVELPSKIELLVGGGFALNKIEVLYKNKIETVTIGSGGPDSFKNYFKRIENDQQH